MKKLFTEDDIIRFLYDEMPPSESKAFLDQLCADEELWEKYEYYQGVVERISGLQYEPSEESVDRVKAYVKESREDQVPTPSTDHVKASFFSLNAVLMSALVLFSTISIAVSAYHFWMESKPLNASNEIMPTTPDPMLDWDSIELEKQMQQLREGVKDLQEAETKPL